MSFNYQCISYTSASVRTILEVLCFMVVSVSIPEVCECDM